MDVLLSVFIQLNAITVYEPSTVFISVKGRFAAAVVKIILYYIILWMNVLLCYCYLLTRSLFQPIYLAQVKMVILYDSSRGIVLLVSCYTTYAHNIVANPHLH